jgi:CheY-like chemotaxis protein
METRHKILVVDDEPTVLELFRELLTQLPSQPEVFTTTSGARALALLKSEPFRLLICDLKMPKMDGLQVLAIVRRRFPELRTVVMTGVTNEEFRSRAYALGVDLYWIKPDTQQNLEMFMQCVESLLGKDQESGFRGVQSKSLMDIIQMECLSQSSTVLRITRGPLVGRIWILGGDVVDAETEGAQGEAAFRRILEWKSGTFENFPSEPARPRTIHKPTHALLLEVAQAIDETAAQVAEPTPDDLEQAEHPKTVRKLAALARAGAEFVISHPTADRKQAESWGTESTAELSLWMAKVMESCQELGQQIQAGPLVHAVANGLDQRVVLFPTESQVYLIGWPGTTPSTDLTEPSKKLVASWDS